jgi:hypothetical protein
LFCFGNHFGLPVSGSGFGSTDLIETDTNPDPDPKQCFPWKKKRVMCYLVAGEGESGLLELVAVSVDAGPELEEDARHAAVTGRGRLHQRRVAVLVVVLHVGVRLQQHTHHLRKKKNDTKGLKYYFAFFFLITVFFETTCTSFFKDIQSYDIRIRIHTSD